MPSTQIEKRRRGPQTDFLLGSSKPREMKVPAWVVEAGLTTDYRDFRRAFDDHYAARVCRRLADEARHPQGVSTKPAALIDPLSPIAVKAEPAEKPFLMPKPARPSDIKSSKLPSSGSHDTWYWACDNLIRIGSTIGGFTPGEICSHRRGQSIAKARQIICWLMRKFTGLSLPGIGRMIGHRDHTTIMHACQRVDAVIAFYGVDIEGSADAIARQLWGLDWRAVRQ